MNHSDESSEYNGLIFFIDVISRVCRLVTVRRQLSFDKYGSGYWNGRVSKNEKHEWGKSIPIWITVEPTRLLWRSSKIKLKIST